MRSPSGPACSQGHPIREDGSHVREDDIRRHGDLQDVQTLRAAVEVLRKRAPRQTFALRCMIRVIETLAARLNAEGQS